MDTILNHFWQRWRKEYLAYLRESQRIKVKQRSAKIQIDDVVIVYDEKQPRHLWQLGRVESLIAGSDGLIRGALVKLGKTGSKINRPVNKLYPLITSMEDNDEINKPVEETGSIPKPKRMAGKIGERKRRFGNK